MNWYNDLIINKNSLLSLNATHKSLPHATIISGPRGVGTFVVANQLARSLSRNILTIGSTDESIKVGDIRDITSFTKTRSNSIRIIIIDNADRMTKPAQNAFLKLLEEPVANTHFILTTHNSQQLIPTVRSRCQEIYLNPASQKQSDKYITDLNIADPTVRRQIEFIATGLPAEISRLATDSQYLEQVSTDIKSVQTLIQGDTYSKVQLVQSLKDDRAKSLELIEKTTLVIRRLLSSQPKPELVSKLDNMITASSRIKLGANVRLQLLNAATLNDK